MGSNLVSKSNDDVSVFRPLYLFACENRYQQRDLDERGSVSERRPLIFDPVLRSQITFVAVAK